MHKLAACRNASLTRTWTTLAGPPIIDPPKELLSNVTRARNSLLSPPKRVATTTTNDGRYPFARADIRLEMTASAA